MSYIELQEIFSISSNVIKKAIFSLKHRIEILNLNNGSTEELERKFNYQQKMIHQLHVNPQKNDE